MESQEVQIVPQETLKTMIQAEQESSMDIARRYPRQISMVKQKVKEYATCDRETAESCFYSKPVAGKNVTGPSIRLAEMVAATYGNIKYGSRVIGVDDYFVTIQAAAQDLENNISFAVEVKRSIRTKDGKKYPQHLIETTIKAASAIGIRDAIYKVVPMGIFSQELKYIQEVGSGKINTDGSTPSEDEIKERVERAVNYFINLGVSPERILAALKVSSVDKITDRHLVTLTGFKNTLKEEEGVSIEDLFPPTVPQQKATDDKQKQDAIKNKVIPPKKEEPVQEAEEVNEPEPEAKEEPNVNTDFAIMVDDEVKKWKTVYGVTTDQICEKFKVEHVHLMTEANVRELEKWRAEILAGSMVFKGLFNEKK